MKYTVIIFILTVILSSCSTIRHSNYVLSYLDSRLESQNFYDSLKNSGIDTILLYHKKHGYYREYFILWLDNSELQLRKINSTGIFEIADWSGNGFYRDRKIFYFYSKHKNIIDTDKLQEDNIRIEGTDTSYYFISHYPYVDINITMGEETKKFHLPYGVNSSLDNYIFHLARLIESTIYNMEQRTYWKETEKKRIYCPQNYDPTKEKWKEWRRKKINKEQIWDDYYH